MAKSQQTDDASMECEKIKWIQKYAERAFDSWQGCVHTIAVSEEYRQQLQLDLAQQYEDPLKRQFVEMTFTD
jgi:hypothetical protein